jgi:VWFA-related protein
MFLRSSGVALVLFSFLVISVNSQTNDTLNASEPTFQSKVHVVVVDIAVTDKNHQPVSGLKRDDFQVFEEGKPQTIASFEEHKSVPPSNAEQSLFAAPLAPNFFTNYPLNKPVDSVNVLLLDALNTPLGDQSNVREQMVSYLKGLHPGQRLAIFTLGSRMRMVEGFTADPAALLAALNNKKFGGGLQVSPMLRSDVEDSADQQALNNMAVSTGGGESAQLQESIAAMRQFLNSEKDFQNDVRSETTLDALQELARYLSGFPGRKNVLWFSGSFPALDHHHVDNDPLLEVMRKKIRQTMNLLAAAQAALYPITAHGLETDSLYNASDLNAPDQTGSAAEQGMPNQGLATNAQNKSLHNDQNTRILQHTTMDDLAINTGGRAFYNTNGLAEAMNDVITNGTHYYSISYASTDKRTDGRYRPIEVKSSTGHYELAYRRGYYADDAKSSQQEGAQANQDPLFALMKRGVPDATQILYQVHVLPKDAQPSEHSLNAGDNAKFQGPAIRYGVDFNVAAKDLNLVATQDGTHHGSLEVSLLVYDHDGKALNWMARRIELSYAPDRFAAVQQSGIPFHLEIDAPKGDIYLCTGIYEGSSNKTGTLEIPLSEVKPLEVPAVAQAPLQNLSAGHETQSGSIKSDSSTALAPRASSVPTESVSTKSNLSPENLQKILEGSQQATKDLNMNSYCTRISKTSEHSAALANVCEFALSLNDKLPNVICDREMDRQWRSPVGELNGNRFDKVTAKVGYRNGMEYYGDLRVDGKPADPKSKPWIGATWSSGEFATSLIEIFSPQSVTSFHFEKEGTLHSVATLEFQFDVGKRNNKSYYLSTKNIVGESTIWYPAYHGRMWLDAANFRLLRLERETAYMPNDPIQQVKTVINYANIALGDGTDFVLPMNSEIITCLPHSADDQCARNIAKFTNWHKFGARTRISTDPTQ